jgi:hypothetical protein
VLDSVINLFPEMRKLFPDIKKAPSADAEEARPSFVANSRYRARTPSAVRPDHHQYAPKVAATVAGTEEDVVIELRRA